MINILSIRNYMRSSLLGASIVSSDSWAWEGRKFNTGNKTVYVEEIVSVDSEDKAACSVFGSVVTFTYNVYTKAIDCGGTANTEAAYGYVAAIADVFDELKTVEIGTTGIRITVDSIRRRPSTVESEGAWRLSPIDITVRAEKAI